MKKHGSATKRAFDELMSKSDAGAHRIGKDQTRQGITGHTPAPAPARRRGNIETLLEETRSPERTPAAPRTVSVAGTRPERLIAKPAPSPAAGTSTSARISPAKVGAENGARNPAVNPAAKKPSTPASLAIPVNRDTGKTAVPHREIISDEPHTRRRAAAQKRPPVISDLQSRRDAAPATGAAVPVTRVIAPVANSVAPVANTTASAKRRQSGKSVARRAVMGIAAAFVVVCAAVTVYAITSDKSDPMSPDILIGGGAAKISEGLSAVSSLSAKSATDETDATKDVPDAILSDADIADNNAAETQNTTSVDSRFTVTFTFYQEESVVCSTPETTVGALMERLGITAGDGKRMYVSADDTISSDTEIRIDTVEYKTEYGTEPVAFTTEYQDVRTIPRGSTKLHRSGKNGVKTVEYFCEYVNGELVGKENRGESITTAPTSQIMYRGVGGSIGGLSYSYYIDVKATTYTGGGITASGLPANESVIAVDPSVIPLGTKVYVTGSYGDFGVRTAADTGGSIKGNKIDVYLERSNPYFGNFGWRNMRVYILG